MLLRPWLAVALLLAGSITPAFAGSPAAAPSRFQLQGQLQGEVPAKSNARFSLRAQLTPRAPQHDAYARFLVSARLEAEGAAKGLCAAPGTIFLNGFESP